MGCGRKHRSCTAAQGSRQRETWFYLGRGAEHGGAELLVEAEEEFEAGQLGGEGLGAVAAVDGAVEGGIAAGLVALAEGAVGAEGVGALGEAAAFYPLREGGEQVGPAGVARFLGKLGITFFFVRLLVRDCLTVF